jgi:hypothetical protein
LNELKFTDKTSELAKDLILSLLHPEFTKRLGYCNHTRVNEHKLFEKFDMLNLSTENNIPINLHSDADISFFEVEKLKSFSSIIFDAY